MCPGIVVLGGGGGGGGGDGDGDGSGDGAGGDGSGNGKDGKGDGKGSGSCGAGGASGCTNCKSKNSAGDPVDVASGKVFTDRIPILFLPGHFNLELLRSYSTARRNIDIGLGHGWQHTLGWELEEHAKELHVLTGDGRVVDLPKPPIGGEVVQGAWGALGFELYTVVRPGNDFLHEFARLSKGDQRHRLRRVMCRHYGDLWLEYEGERLAKVTDTVGRTILFSAAPDGFHIGTVSVPSPDGPTIVFARFEYDARNDLVAATDADGHTTRYAYDEDHRLVRLEYPTGLVVHWVYDDLGRCRETWADYPSGTDPALEPSLPKTLADDRTPAKGILHCRLEYGDDYTEVVDSVGIGRFFSGPDGQTAKAVSAAGGVTERAFDAAGRVIAMVDPTGGRWTYEYDAQDNVVREIDPEGHAVTVQRDFAGREIELVDAAGGKTTVVYDTHGNLEFVRDAAGGEESFRHDARGHVLGAVDSRGGQHVYHYDPHGNRVSEQYPNGGIYRYEYDWWGRCVRRVDPLGAEARCVVSPSGLVRSLTNATQRTTAFERDAMGQLATIVRPDGGILRFERGGNGWPCRVIEPDGSTTRCFYNREGWLVALENAKGERHEVSYRADGMPVKERFFHGQVARYGLDVWGRIVWVDDGAGRVDRTLSPVGRLLAEEGPDGEVRTYEYDARGELVKATDGAVAFEWTRDPRGRILTESFEIQGRRYEVLGKRTPGGDRTAFATSLGLDAAVQRDQNGLVVGLNANGRPVVSIARNELGLPVRTDLSSGGSILQKFDPDRRLRQRQILGSGGSRSPAGEPEWLGPGGLGHRESWEYSAIDEITSVSTSDGPTIELEYDIRRHLKQRRIGTAVERFDVDATSDYYEAGAGAPVRRYGAGSQLLGRDTTSYEYDQRGYLLTKRRQAPGAPDELTRYVWSDFGLLSAVELPDGRTVEFAYDPFARRVSKRLSRGDEIISHRHYVWDLVSLVHEVDVGVEDGAAPAVVRTYLYEDNNWDTPLAHRGAGDWTHYVHDINGAPEQLLDGAGRQVGQQGWTAFGRTVPGPESRDTTPFRFRGQFEDEETGLHYNRYRYYDPEIGRYISPDPIGLEGGLNLYGYGPNPVGWADPMGWKHYLEVEDADNSGFKPSGMAGGAPVNAPGQKNPPYDYISGTSDKWGKCPEVLQTQPKCHTEQKFAKDLIDFDKDTDGGAKGKTYNLKGQYPPCPRCHAAMTRAAQETGSKITYKWGGSTITYDGTSKTGGGKGNAPAISGDTNKAKGFVKAYDGQTDLGKANLQGGPTGKERSAADTWGYQPAAGSQGYYQTHS